MTLGFPLALALEGFPLALELSCAIPTGPRLWRSLPEALLFFCFGMLYEALDAFLFFFVRYDAWRTASYMAASSSASSGGGCSSRPVSCWACWPVSKSSMTMVSIGPGPGLVCTFLGIGLGLFGFCYHLFNAFLSSPLRTSSPHHPGPG